MSEPKIIYGQKKNADWFGGGALIQILGVLLCLTVIGALIGIPLIIWGGIIARKKKCSECGMEIPSRVMSCPVCHCRF